MRSLCILKMGRTIPEIAARRGDFEEWILAGLGYEAERVVVVSPFEGEPLPDPRDCSGVVITGSSAMVSERVDWSERVAEWIPGVMEAGSPMLGICYGHQLIAHAMGGRVELNPRGREIGTVRVELGAEAADDPLLAGLPSSITVHVSHVESVTELPPGARLHGASAGDPNQAFSLGDRTWGVQFHPEFDEDVVRGYIAGRREILIREEIDPDELLEQTRESDHGTRVLRRFGEIVSREDGSEA